jgi:hypothetical protein
MENAMTNPDDANLLSPEDACPNCGERRIDLLVWVDDQWVHCQTCRIQYDPLAGLQRPIPQ